jgi:hypothetical protein
VGESLYEPFLGTPKKNYIPQFLKQRDINSYYLLVDAEELGEGENEGMGF